MVKEPEVSLKPSTKGIPENPLYYASKSTRNLERILKEKGHGSSLARGTGKLIDSGSPESRLKSLAPWPDFGRIFVSGQARFFGKKIIRRFAFSAGIILRQCALLTKGVFFIIVK
jgi:hypothetical protein